MCIRDRLDAIDIKDRLITADALLTQRKLADYLVQRGAHYHFTAKGNQATLEKDIALLFEKRKKPDFVEVSPPDHGRIETRRIWCSDAVSDTHLDVYKRQALTRAIKSAPLMPGMFRSSSSRSTGTWRRCASTSGDWPKPRESHISGGSSVDGIIRCKAWMPAFEMPVSYTHLDVYKRQDLAIGRC